MIMNNKKQLIQIINTIYLLLLICSISLNLGKKIAMKKLNNKTSQSFNTNSMIYYDSSKSKLEKLEAKMICAKGSLTGFSNIVNFGVKSPIGGLSYTFSYGCTSGSSLDIFNSSVAPIKGTESSLVNMKVTKRNSKEEILIPIGNSCSCADGQVMNSLEFYTDEKLKNHIGVRCSCIPAKQGEYECKKKENSPIIMDANRCPIYGYRLYMYLGRIPVNLSPGVLKSITFGYNDKSVNCNDNYCENHVAMDFEYCYPKGRAPIGVSLTSGNAAPAGALGKPIDPATVPYESELGPNVTSMNTNGFDKNTFSKVFFDNDKEKLPEKINSSISCKGAGALKGFDLSKREDIKFKWGSYYSFNYGCTKGDKNDFVDSAALEFQGNSATDILINVPKKDQSGFINQPIGNSCTCPQDSVMKNIEFVTNPDLKNPYLIKCSCVKTKKPVTCLKKTEEPRNLGSKCPVLGYGIYPKLKLNVSEGSNRVLKSFTFAFNDSTKNCNSEFCQHLANFEYEYCFETGTQKINPQSFGPIPNPEIAAKYSSTKSSSSYTYVPPTSKPTSIPTTVTNQSSGFLKSNTLDKDALAILNSLGLNQPINSQPIKTATSSPIIIRSTPTKPISNPFAPIKSNTFILPSEPIKSNTIISPTQSPTRITTNTIPVSTSTSTTVTSNNTNTVSSSTTQAININISAISKGPISNQDIQTIVNVHNTLRNQMATQTTEFGAKYPKAGNMRQMYWSEEIAKLAQEHANKKVFAHSDSSFRKTSQFSYLGENLYTASSSYSDFPPNWDKGVRSWFSEIKDYAQTTEVVTKFQSIPSAMIGHFTQVIWADTYLVGCGVSTYPTSKNGMSLTTHLMVCIYGPGGNYTNKPIYNPVTADRICPVGTVNSLEYSGLCCVPTKCTSKDLILN